MFKRLKEKRIKELEEMIELLKEKLDNSNKHRSALEEENYKYKRLFSKLFTRLSATNVVHYKVDNNLAGYKAEFVINYDDGTNFKYEVKLVSTGYEEDLNGQVNKTRQD